MAVTGDLTTRIPAVHGKAAAIPFTVVSTTDLGDPESQLNVQRLSGKSEGYGFVAKDGSGNLSLYLATGSAPTDKWVKVGGATDGTDDITPA